MHVQNQEYACNVLYGAVRAIWSLVRYVCVTCIGQEFACDGM